MPERSAEQRRSASTLHCAKCQYDLTGLRQNICPECGTPFDPAAPPRRKRPPWLLVIVATLIVMYGPFGWLLLMNDDGAYIRHWLVRGPVLPGLVPTFLLLAPFNILPGKLPEWLAISMMAAITIAAAAIIILISRRGYRWFIITMIIALALSIINSLVAHKIFAA